MKRCRKCGGSGPFGCDSRAKDGLSNRCKNCAVEATRVWRERNAVDPLPVTDAKRCTECDGGGPFYRQRGTKDGLSTKCIACLSKVLSRQPDVLRRQAVARRKANPEKARARDKRERERYRERRKANWDAWAYGLKPGEREAMFRAQGGLCAICNTQLKRDHNTVLDHHHGTRRVRGLLCRPCNTMIARFKEAKQRMCLAIAYLERPAPKLPVLVSLHINDWTTREGRQRYLRRDYLMRNYRITPEQFEWLVLQQGSACPICLTELPCGKNRHVDHSHSTGEIRGVLCNDCNVGLGQAKDSPAVLAAAIAYLRR